MKTGIGLDIGTYSIKLIELKKIKGEREIACCAQSVIKGGDVERALRDILKDLRLASRRVNVSLAGPSVIVRYIEMPPMKKEELESAIKFEADKYIPFNINEVIIDCAQLDRLPSGSQRVLLVAAKKDTVDGLLGLLRKVGLETDAIDVDSISLFNLFERVGLNKNKEKTIVLLNIGSRFSNMGIIVNSNLCFTRDIFWGGRDVTERIKDALSVGLDEAESLKCSPGDRKEEIRSLITPVLDRLSLDIRRSLDYFETHFGRSIDDIYISGGGSFLFNTIDFLKDCVGTNVNMWNCFDRVKVGESLKEEALRHYPSKFYVALGLAMRDI